MLHIESGKLRQDFSETVNRVAYGHERIIVRRRGKNLAALIPVDDLELLERLEDEEDVKEAEKVLARARAKGEKPIPWDEARKKFGF
jgi:prevent-host-death family protein